MVKDINLTGGSHSNPSSLTVMSGTLFVAAYDPELGLTLARTPQREVAASARGGSSYPLRSSLSAFAPSGSPLKSRATSRVRPSASIASPRFSRLR